MICDDDEAALIANVDVIWIGDLEEALFEELRGAVRNLTIALHFAEAKAAVARSALHRLAIHHLHGTASARMDFVVDHMLEALIVGGADGRLAL